MKKGVVVNYLCTNPSCDLSENKLEIKEPLTMLGNTARFNTLKCCPKCKSGVEMINFVSGVVEIKVDKVNTEEKEKEEE